MKRTLAVLLVLALILAPAPHVESGAPKKRSAMLTQQQASAFARLALKGIQKEYPNKLGIVLNGAADVKGPKALHPAFYGCFDWHSS
ncbi:MAG: DUF2891 family protein, partial [Gemmataceae bacterium]|nr:DUF2891 family protein [Gemmataceae bacterium]